MKEELLRKLEVLSPHLPPNTLDELINDLGGPSRVGSVLLSPSLLLPPLCSFGRPFPPSFSPHFLCHFPLHQVAEMTGRRGRVVSLPDGSVHYQLRSESDVSLEMLNLTEKQRFMDGEKNIAIISEAASSGISLQSDRRAKVWKRVSVSVSVLKWGVGFTGISCRIMSILTQFYVVSNQNACREFTNQSINVCLFVCCTFWYVFVCVL